MVKQNMPFLIAVFLLVLYSGFLFGQVGSPIALRKTAEEYYRWRNENYPVNSSDKGLHTWDNRLTDYSQSALVSRSNTSGICWRRSRLCRQARGSGRIA